MNLDKLTPAPWRASAGMVTTEAVKDYPRLADCTWGDIGDDETVANSQFIALARNALEVMMRRGWGVERFSLLGGGFGWRMRPEAWDMGQWNRLGVATDPFTALIEADKWYRNNVERKL